MKSINIKSVLIIAVVAMFTGNTFAQKGNLFPLYAEEYNRKTGEMIGKVWRSENHMRSESLLEDKTVMIYRSDSAALYLIDPQAKTIMVLPIEKLQGLAKSLTGVPVTSNDKLLGKENIEGYECDHIQNKQTAVNNGRASDYYRESWWYEPYKFEIMSKEEGLDHRIMRNIKPGAQPASLFELPKGYTLIGIPGVNDKMKQMQQIQDMLKQKTGK